MIADGPACTKRFFRKVLKRHDRPVRIVIDGSQTEHEAISSYDPEYLPRDQSRRATLLEAYPHLQELIPHRSD